MTIVFAVLSFVFARKLGQVLGGILGIAIAGAAMVVAAPFLLLPVAFRRARRRSAQVERQEAAAGVMNNSQAPTETLEAPQRAKSPVIPLNPRKQP